MRVVVVGGGLSGLVFAYSLLRDARSRGTAPPEIVVLEASDRLGGNLRTERHDGFLLDGPDGFVIARPQALDLCVEIGLGEELIETIAENRRVYLVRKGALFPLPDDVFLGVPTRLRSVLTSNLLSWRAKARLVADRVLPRGAAASDGSAAGDDGAVSDDVSIGQIVEGRLGAEVAELLVEPLLGGVYAGSIDELSARAVFPQLAEVALRRGSLMRGMRRARGARRAAEGRRPSPFRSLRGGMGDLVRALVDQLGTVDIRTGITIKAAWRKEAGWRLGFVTGETIDADHLVVATSAHAAALLLTRLDPALATELQNIPYTSAAIAYLGYRREQIRHPLDATGFLVPKSEGLAIMGTTFVSSKWSGRAPSGHILLRTFIGGAHHDDLAAKTDDDLLGVAKESLAPLLGIDGSFALGRVFRYPKSSPQPIVGHHARVQRINELASAHSHLSLVGNAYEGVGMPDAIRVARRAANRLAALL